MEVSAGGIQTANMLVDIKDPKYLSGDNVIFDIYDFHPRYVYMGKINSGEYDLKENSWRYDIEVGTTTHVEVKEKYIVRKIHKKR